MTVTSTTTTTITSIPKSHSRTRIPHGKSTPLTSTIHRPITETRLSPVLADTVVPKQSLRVKIDDRWFDLSKWQMFHPGGMEVLQHMDGIDATDAFYSLHSKDAVDRMKRMHSSASLPNDTPPPSQTTLNFRAFRAQLQKEGWFERSFLWEAFYLLSVMSLAIGGTILSKLYGYHHVAIILISVAMQQAGWVGHDHTHGRGSYCKVMSFVHSGLLNALSRGWWSNKHNTHHVYTNHLGIDVDIENDPVIHLFFPKADKDVYYRKYQHYYFIFAYSFLFASWRMQSFQYAWKKKILSELFCMVVNYSWLVYIGWYVSIMSILLSGFLVAIVVTVTHQSEEMFGAEELQNFSFVEGQFLTTRDAWTDNPIMNWLWGGMQYQLEHHLFPTMPKYKYRALTSRVKKFAKDNGIEYRVDTVMDVWKRNAITLKYYAGERPKIN